MSDENQPMIETGVLLPEDGNPVYSMRTTNIRTVGDMELLVAAAFNGLNLHVANYCRQEGIDLRAAQLRINHMLMVLAQGNERSPMQFQAQSNADTSTTDPETEAQDGETPPGSSDRDVFGENA